MDKTLHLNTSREAEKPTDFKAAVRKIFAKMYEINARIGRSQAETAELHAGTRVMLDQLRAA